MATHIINFDDVTEKRKYYDYLKQKKGVHKIRDVKSRLYNGRYKYYFSHVMKVLELSNRFANDEGEPLNSAQIHEIMKVKFNPIIIHEVKGRIYIKGDTTTNLEDQEFIGNYEDQIIAHYSSDPYYLEFMHRSEWIEQQKELHEKRKNGNDY